LSLSPEQQAEHCLDCFNLSSMLRPRSRSETEWREVS
jgi:hypothetical protein